LMFGKQGQARAKGKQASKQAVGCWCQVCLVALVGAETRSIDERLLAGLVMIESVTRSSVTRAFGGGGCFELASSWCMGRAPFPNNSTAGLQPEKRPRCVRRVKVAPNLFFVNLHVIELTARLNQCECKFCPRNCQSCTKMSMKCNQPANQRDDTGDTIRKATSPQPTTSKAILSIHLHNSRPPAQSSHTGAPGFFLCKHTAT
jgi:hypothetical protein